MKKTKSILALVLLASVFTFCKKDDPAPEPEPEPVAPVNPGIGVNSTYQTEFTLDGTNYKYEVGKDSILSTKTNDKVQVSISSKKAVYHSAFVYGVKQKPRFKVSKSWLTINDDAYPAEQSFRNYFMPSAVGFSTGNVDGIRLSWIDATGKEWATDKSSGDQSTSEFKIVANKEVKNAYQEMIIYATFNCKLYDDNGASKTLTNGKFVGTFENH
jgi:hypothetical protein